MNKAGDSEEERERILKRQLWKALFELDYWWARKSLCHLVSLSTNGNNNTTKLIGLF